jgi:fucose permease
MPYLVLGVSGIVLFVSSLFMANPPAHAEERMSLVVARRVFSDRAVVLLALAIGLYVGSEMSLAWLASRLLEVQYGATEGLAAQAALLFWLTMGVGRVIVGMLSHRVSGYHLLCWLVGGGLASYLVILGWPTALGLWVGVGLAGFTFSGIWPLLVGLGANRYPAYTGTVVALLVSSGTAGGLVFPALCGYLLEDHPASMIVLLMAVLFALLAVVLGVYGRATASPAPPPTQPVDAHMG